MQRLLLIIYTIVLALPALAQKITGVVTDAQTGEPLPYVNVYYKGGRIGVQSNEQGKYSISYHPDELYFSCVGYTTKRFTPKRAREFNVMLEQTETELSTATVTAQRKKYSRKNNPAVELMKKVIARKNLGQLKNHDYYSFDRYNKLVLSINNINDSIQNWKFAKKNPFLYEHVETCNFTGKRILPISVEETVEREIYRRSTDTQKLHLLGRKSSGINDVFATGDILNTLLQECFTTVNINDDKVQLLQYPFISPLSTNYAISFYRYFLQDTIMVEGRKCIDVAFTPNNPQDFGFSGHLFVMADSTYRVHRADITIPQRSDINFVESMRIIQRFEELPSGEQVLGENQMILELSLVEGTPSMQVKRMSAFSNYSFATIPDKDFDFRGNTRTDSNANIRNNEYWQAHRPTELTDSEENMQNFVLKMQQIKGYRAAMWVMKAFVENFVETSTDPKRPSKLDIGPINTIFSQNFVEGYRIRGSFQTTANLHPQLFFKGYAAYGIDDHCWKGSAEFTYTFEPKEYLPHEFPGSKLSLTLYNDVVSPTDKFISTDKDNVFTSFKWTDVHHMLYTRYARINLFREWENGLSYNVGAKIQRDVPTAKLFYQPLNGAAAPTQSATDNVHALHASELCVGITYQPGITWVNTKQRRIPTNHDAPKFSLQHNFGLKGILGSDHNYNFTEVEIYKRFWTPSWGRIDTYIKAGAQWNRVPFPYLIVPAANLSYIKDDNTFSLMTNMEFLNDRYAAIFASWDLNGKIFNRLPLIRHLKLREYFGFSALWGHLTSKNNPMLKKNSGDSRLYYFPGKFENDGTYTPITTTMKSSTPYVEAYFGLYNILKFFNVEYVRRLTYLDNPETDRWGIRARFVVTF
ncbi:MAG: carboxypeptidase-like regulatory domain-containing protein [Bacteroidaceae bacterium]|nr:carboxypeptidase-like regulatory domain-containing protein [Bacteroidaceae bacterium]